MSQPTFADAQPGALLVDHTGPDAVRVDHVYIVSGAVTVGGRYFADLAYEVDPVGVGQPFTVTGPPDKILVPAAAHSNPGPCVPADPAAVRLVASAVRAELRAKKEPRPGGIRLMNDVIDVADHWETNSEETRDWAQDVADARYRHLVEMVARGHLSPSVLPTWETVAQGVLL